MSKFIDVKSFLVTVLGDFNGFLGSDGLPGSPVGALGLPWVPNVTPKTLPRGSGGGFGLDFGVPGRPLERYFSHKMCFFSDPILGRLLGPLFLVIFIDF